MNVDLSICGDATIPYGAKSGVRPRQKYGRQEKILHDFSCLHCHGYVSIAPWLSGVQNRNHCPYCLYSRHVDLFQVGDRMAVCHAEMRPIGLTLKSTRKRYGGEWAGELMLIHLCADCGKISINRMAADDDAHTVLEIFENSQVLDAAMRTSLKTSGIRLLETDDLKLIYRRLFGQN